MLTTVMYHYVRPIAGSKNPNIKGLEIKKFRGQLDYLTKNYNIVSAEDVMAAINNKKSLPERACWLTFDDGYKDNYLYVMEELVARNVQGSFFLVSEACKANMILAVNKIHFILDAVVDIDALILDLRSAMMLYGYSDYDWQNFYKKNAISNRFDNQDVIFFKRMLQRELPENVRSDITDKLFCRYVASDKKDFANNLYLNEREIKEMRSEGMFFGNHTKSHPWLNALSYEEQYKEIFEPMQYLKNIGAIAEEDWMMCYPYGGHDDNTIKILTELKCGAAATVKPAKSDLLIGNKYEISRFDTNDFPHK